MCTCVPGCDVCRCTDKVTPQSPVAGTGPGVEWALVAVSLMSLPTMAQRVAAAPVAHGAPQLGGSPRLHFLKTMWLWTGDCTSPGFHVLIYTTRFHDESAPRMAAGDKPMDSGQSWLMKMVILHLDITHNPADTPRLRWGTLPGPLLTTEDEG